MEYVGLNFLHKMDKKQFIGIIEMMLIFILELES
jgi:hypothetical protein